MDALTQIVVWLNDAANTAGRPLLAPLGLMPGWLSATVVSAVTGVLLLVVFKYTSNQKAIRRARNDINAQLLALKLFKESARVALRSQGRILVGAGRLMLLAIVPMLVMAVPVCLLLGQLGLWYQARPLRVGEEAVVTLKLNGTTEPRPEVTLLPTDAVEVALGPVRVPSKGEVCWQLRARQPGHHRLVFLVEGHEVEKDLAVGDGFMRVSAQRPGWNWSDVLLHPWESPFRPGSSVGSIEIDYPRRDSWTSGTDSWVIYWFAVSMVAGFCLRRWLNVDV